jgi:hypothetical protein
MILVVTDEVEPWFRYIWDQFAQINSLNIESRITTCSDYQLTYPSHKNLVIEYNFEQRLTNSLFIPKRKRFKSNEYVWADDDLPVYQDTIQNSTRSNLYDIFYNAFVHLSRLEEWESEKNGAYIHSYSFKHPKKNKKIWRIAVVNSLFNELEKWIKRKYPEVSFGDRSAPIIEFSHDVDYINKTIQLRIKQPLFNFFKCGKHLLQLSLRDGFSDFKKGVSFACRNCDYWCFDGWTRLEKELDIKSVYYFFSKSDYGKLNPKRWLLDPSYDIAKNGRLKQKCRELISEGNQIGIHGSYFSSEDGTLFMKEKEILENSINYKITKSRQHWLNYYESKTPYIHCEARIEQDSTLGFNDISGFRAGVASIYNPYDHKNNIPFPFKEIPLVIVDSHFYDYLDDYAQNHLEWLFDSMSKVKNFGISVIWHQRVISSDYGWDQGYKKLVSMVKNRDI